MATLAIGVACLYLLVFGIVLIAAVSVLDPSVLGSELGHPAGWDSYLRLAWMAATMALVAGALGSTLESDAAVRQAAYCYRERQRRAHQSTHEHR